jgi:hypothetical protein
MNLVRAIAIACVAAAPLTASAAQKIGPTWSELTGQQVSRVKKNLLPAVVKEVDGRDYTYRVIKVEPGERVIRVQSPMRKGFPGTDREMKLDLKPCVRYYLNAQFASTTGPGWEPVVALQEPVSGCKVPKPAK